MKREVGFNHLLHTQVDYLIQGEAPSRIIIKYIHLTLESNLSDVEIEMTKGDQGCGM
jgi:hypothetical protein